MKHTHSYFGLLLGLWFCIPLFSANGQSNYAALGIKHPRKKSSRINFEMAHNLVIIPIKINDSDTLRFILDTGVTHTLLTDLTANDALTLQYSRKVDLFGLGSGRPIEALHSYGNELMLPGIYGNFQDLIVPLQNIFQLSENLGMQVNGLLGYEIFQSFIVEIDYSQKKLTLHDPVQYRARLERRTKRWLKREKAVALPLEIIRRKPYIRATVQTSPASDVPVMLLVDSGASQALSLYASTHEKLEIPAQSFRSFLGMGLSGEIFGYTGKIESITLGQRYRMSKPIVSFPDDAAVREALNVANRNGTLGADVLRRFTVIFDYLGQQLILRPNFEFKTPFSYNMSGIELGTPIPGMPIFQVTEVRKGSVGEEAGIRRGDQLMGINGVNIANYTLSDLLKLFHSRAGRRLRLAMHRNGTYYRTELVLRDDLEERTAGE